LKMKILVDTNVLLALVDSKTDFFALAKDEFLDARFFVLKQSLDELKAKRPSAFQTVKTHLEKNNVQTIEGKGRADDLLLDWGKREKGVVATMDFALKKRLKRAGVQIISLKNGKLVL
jgi:rRNA-processing protein FCF1